jgi:hypothetical protein
MKPYEKFLNESLGLKELVEAYLQIRKYFQELGFSEEDLKKVTNVTSEMMSLYQNFQNIQKSLFQQVKDYGLEIDRDEFLEYLTPILSKIDEITPLSHGNHKRRNQRDEDY